MQRQSVAEDFLSWIRDLFTDPTHDPRPSPSTGEAWLVAGVDNRHPNVTYVENDRSAVEQLIRC